MRILQISNTYPPADISGVGTLVAELHQELLRGGHESVVIARQATAQPGVVAVGGRKLLFPLHAALATRRLLRAGALFDAVHVHESDGVLAAWWLRSFGTRSRGTRRPRIFATLQVSYRRERLAVRAVRAQRGSGEVLSRPVLAEWIFKWLRAPLLALFGRISARCADGVVAPSQATAQELREDYGVARVTVIPNGIAIGAAAARTEDAPGQSSNPTVLFVGRLRTRKAAALLVEAWRAVAVAVPSARLVLLGGGEQQAHLAERIAALNLGASVRLAGAVPRAEIAGWLSAADVFCLPSTYEGLPLAILEAMACGLPVVATAVAGVPEAVDHGRTGLLVPSEDVSALAQALVRLLREPALRRQMGAAGRRVLEERFAIARVTAAYVAFWSGQVEAGRA